jgi:homoserine dehydrogenase
MGESLISIEAILQKEPAQGESTATIIMLTQRIREAQMNSALESIQKLKAISGQVTRIRVESLSAD